MFEPDGLNDVGKTSSNKSSIVSRVINDVTGLGKFAVDSQFMREGRHPEEVFKAMFGTTNLEITITSVAIGQSSLADSQGDTSKVIFLFVSNVLAGIVAGSVNVKFVVSHLVVWGIIVVGEFHKHCGDNPVTIIVDKGFSGHTGNGVCDDFKVGLLKTVTELFQLKSKSLTIKRGGTLASKGSFFMVMVVCVGNRVLFVAN